MSEDVVDAKEVENNAPESTGGNSSMINPSVPDINTGTEEERPRSLTNPVDKTPQAGRSSSPGSYVDHGTPDFEVDIEGSLAHSSKKSAKPIKREKRFLPPDEPNVVSEEVSLDDYFTRETPPLGAFLRNAIVSAVVTETEKERHDIKESMTPESAGMDNSNSEASTPDNLGNELNTSNSNIILTEFQRDTVDNRATAKSDTYLLNETSEQKVSSCDEIRAKSAEPCIEYTTSYTQTEWSWLEDIEKLENLRTQLEVSVKVESSDEEDVQSDSAPSSPSVTPDDVQTREDSAEPEDKLFKEPTMDDSSESSSDDDEQDFTVNKDLLLPSIGPPKILQYIKESANPLFTNDTPKKDTPTKILRVDASRRKTLTVGLEGETIKFAQAELVEGEEEVEVEQTVEVISEEEAKEEEQDIPVDQASSASEEPTYEDLLKEQAIYEEDKDFITDPIIDIKPHPPFGTKAARKAAKERAAERAREREIERQKVSGNSTNFYAMTRQMKTLAYSLASTKCMDDGWTVKKPNSPSNTESEERFEPFEIKINASMTQLKETFVERYYTNGKRLLIIFPDGTGTCYYPSGNPAVIISSTEKGKFSYIVQEDISEHSRDYPGIVGVFNPTGHGCCYYEASNIIRMVLTPFGGTYFDSHGVKKKKWLWYNNHGNHVHAPPFQPITFALTKALSIRCMGQDCVIITYNYGRHTIRFNVGARLKAAKKIKPPRHEDDYEIQLKEIRQFVNLVIERIRSTLKFPHSTRITKLPPEIPERPPGPRQRRRETRLLEQEDLAAVIVN